MTQTNPSCNLCGASNWTDQGSRVGVRCGNCGSLERTRVVKLLLDHHGFPQPAAKILHFAPERGLASWFAELSPEGYDPVDLEPEGYRFAKVRRFDVVTDMASLPSDHYDLILHSHIIEHLPINLAYFFFHASRALKEDGFHVFVAPLMGGYYDEYFGPLSKEEATKRFGQDDHVRWLGVKDFDRHLGALMRLDKDFDLTKTFSEQILQERNIPASQQKGLHGSTVFITRKDDYCLASRAPVDQEEIKEAEKLLSPSTHVDFSWIALLQSAALVVALLAFAIAVIWFAGSFPTFGDYD